MDHVAGQSGDQQPACPAGDDSDRLACYLFTKLSQQLSHRTQLTPEQTAAQRIPRIGAQRQRRLFGQFLAKGRVIGTVAKELKARKSLLNAAREPGIDSALATVLDEWVDGF